MKKVLGIGLIIFGFVMPFVSTWLFGIPKVVSTLHDPWQWVFGISVVAIMLPGVILISL